MDFRRMKAEYWISAINDALRAGYPPESKGPNKKCAARAASDALDVDRVHFFNAVGKPDRPGSLYKRFGLSPDWSLYKAVVEEKKEEKEENPFAIDHMPSPAYTSSEYIFELTSSSDNRFIFGAAGDLHAASKYTRWDVRESLYKHFIDAGAQCNFDTGNWIDGEKRGINEHDLEVHGFDQQVALLAERHPKGLMTCAIWGDDHEGWYAQREGIDVGRYAENAMRLAGHEWVNLGYLEARVLLRNANTGKTAELAVHHPGGGSAYAVSYAIQKIVEGYDSADKPDMGLYGHYHKLEHIPIRQVWCIQTGCQQDQTPWQRKKKIMALVGGALAEVRQNPETGGIVSCKVEIFNEYITGLRGGRDRWSKHGTVILPKRGLS